MDARAPSTDPPAIERGHRGSRTNVADLVGTVYASAPAEGRAKLVEQLLRPLGLLSVVAVANGLFAQIRFRNGWQDFTVRPEDIHNVSANDVIVLVDHVQSVGVEAMEGLTRLLATSPLLAGSAAAALVLALLVQQASARHPIDTDDD